MGDTERRCCDYPDPGLSGSLWTEEEQDLMGEDEGEEVNTKVGKDVAHPPVGVHGAVDDLSWNARQ